MCSSLSESLGCILGGALIITKAKRIRLASILASICPIIGAIGLLVCFYNHDELAFLFVILINIGNGANFVLQSVMVVNLVT